MILTISVRERIRWVRSKRSGGKPTELNKRTIVLSLKEGVPWILKSEELNLGIKEMNKSSTNEPYLCNLRWVPSGPKFFMKRKEGTKLPFGSKSTNKIVIWLQKETGDHPTVLHVSTDTQKTSKMKSSLKRHKGLYSQMGTLNPEV